MHIGVYIYKLLFNTHLYTQITAYFNGFLFDIYFVKNMMF